MMMRATFTCVCAAMVSPLRRFLTARRRMLRAMAREFADVAVAYSTALADGNVTANELANLGRQWGELEVVAQRMLAHAQALHEAAKPKGDGALVPVAFGKRAA